QSETDLTQAIAIQVHASLYTVPETVARAMLPLQAVEDFERQLVATERGHEVRALHTIAYREQHLAGDLDAFLARRLAAGRLAHPLPGLGGDLHAGHLVVEDLGVLVADERQHAHHDRELQRSDALEHSLEQLGLEDR